MATLYVDLVSGNDTTGDGSSGNPYLTVNKALSIAGGPHDIRVAKTTAHTTVSSATCTFTNGSTTVSTSASLVGTIAVGDYIGKTSAVGNGGGYDNNSEIFWRVNAVAAGALTLECKYTGASESVASILKATIITTGVANTTAITIAVAGTQLSGGWDLSTITQDGETWLKGNFTRTYSSSRYIVYSSVEANISMLNIVEGYYAVYASASNILLSNLTVLGAYSIGIYYSGSNISSSYCVAQAGSAVNGAFYLGAGSTAQISDCLILTASAGTGYGVYNMSITAATLTRCMIFDAPVYGIRSSQNNLTLIGCYFSGCNVAVWMLNNTLVQDCTFVSCPRGLYSNAITTSIVVKGTTFDSCTYACDLRYFTGALFDDCDFNSCTYGIYLDAYSNGIYVYGCRFLTPVTLGIYGVLSTGRIEITGCSIDDASIGKAFSQTAGASYVNPLFILQDSFGQSGTYWANGQIVQDNSEYRTTPPSQKISFNTAETYKACEYRVLGCYATAGVGKSFNFWMKKHASWSGAFTPSWRLNGIQVKTENEVNSLSTSWTEYTYNCEDEYMSATGELTLNFLLNSNNNPFWIDDFVVEDLPDYSSSSSSSSGI